MQAHTLADLHAAREYLNEKIAQEVTKATQYLSTHHEKRDQPHIVEEYFEKHQAYREAAEAIRVEIQCRINKLFAVPVFAADGTVIVREA